MVRATTILRILLYGDATLWCNSNLLIVIGVRSTYYVLFIYKVLCDGVGGCKVQQGVRVRESPFFRMRTVLLFI